MGPARGGDGDDDKGVARRLDERLALRQGIALRCRRKEGDEVFKERAEGREREK